MTEEKTMKQKYKHLFFDLDNTLWDNQNELLPHCIEVLEYLKPKYNICAISNGAWREQSLKITANGLDRHINNVYFSERVGCAKPDRRIFEHAAKSNNARKAECLMIGDNFQTDIAGAKNFGIDQLYIPCEREDTGNLAFVPTYLINSLIELKNIL
jgi:putative hydrolase of the HAD superfamily